MVASGMSEVVRTANLIPDVLDEDLDISSRLRAQLKTKLFFLRALLHLCILWQFLHVHSTTVFSLLLEH